MAGVLGLLLLAYVFAGGERDNRDALTDQQVAGSEGNPKGRCGAAQTYDLIKRELFRRAALLRGADQAAFDRLSTYSVVRMGAPTLESFDQDVGTITCSGSLALDLPPGFQVVGGRRTLAADIGYSVQPEADGSGDVLTLSNVDAIIAPLATLGRSGGEPQDRAEASGASDQEAPVRPPATNEPPPERSPVPTANERDPSPAAAPPATATTRPSFDCRRARTRGEIAVCRNTGLATLDRQMAAQFNRGMSRGTAAQRARLERTRARFLSTRDSCRSVACMADAYRARTREIGAIMADGLRPAPSATPAQASPPPPAAAAGPSFNCRYARTRGEIAVCRDAGLAGLDRQTAGQFNLAMSRGTPAQQSLLRQTRSRFLSYRDACRSRSCIAAAYRNRMKEMSDIMAGRWKVP